MERFQWIVEILQDIEEFAEVSGLSKTHTILQESLPAIKGEVEVKSATSEIVGVHIDREIIALKYGPSVLSSDVAPRAEK